MAEQDKTTKATLRDVGSDWKGWTPLSDAGQSTAVRWLEEAVGRASGQGVSKDVDSSV